MYDISETGSNQAVLAAILSGIQREASDLEFCSRLADAAPTQEHRSNIMRVLESKRPRLQQFSNLYAAMTGRSPAYRFAPAAFSSYAEGLRIAYQAGIEEYEEYRTHSQLVGPPILQQMFMDAFRGAYENIAQFDELNRNVSRDAGPNPFVVNIEKVTEQNDTYRTAIWTGEHLQVTVMSIGVGDDIGLEVHPSTDQFIRIEEGQGLVQMGDRQDHLDFEARAHENYAVMVPAGTWHNITNTGNKPLKVYTIYAPPHHPHGTVHLTKAAAKAAEG
ncbi:hypothetical protein J41TS12_13510 [Paenibacillus antibioticophila]|uniref:Cupin type-2 domain-containing protein n=1 Tax=Paenibacillus antibioticophila TaxID=1274374 RepID=A0A920CED0_9BACL|nr:cupin domain-containing protein [Paenibacillus antibioticophila]GIO36490.1 hypothetical protein J41TS12_13510 [Paenibacillus antibioticophila]